MGGNWSEPYASEGETVGYWSSDAARIKFNNLLPVENSVTVTGTTEPTLLSTYHAKTGDIWVKSNNRYYYVDADIVKKAYESRC